MFCGTLACQNGPIKWVGQHRIHHAGSDTIEDPHSAEKGFWWSHVTWMLFNHSKFDDKKILSPMLGNKKVSHSKVSNLIERLGGINDTENLAIKYINKCKVLAGKLDNDIQQEMLKLLDSSINRIK